MDFRASPRNRLMIIGIIGKRPFEDLTKRRGKVCRFGLHLKLIQFLKGGVFKLELHFNENYDMKPPLVHFVTVPFHPNIDMETGKPCMEFLDDPTCWIPSSYSIRTILIHLQVLLASPTFSSPPVNVKAYNTLINSTRLYNQLAMDCVVASRRVEGGYI